jgi:hypothetical protein
MDLESVIRQQEASRSSCHFLSAKSCQNGPQICNPVNLMTKSVQRVSLLPLFVTSNEILTFSNIVWFFKNFCSVAPSNLLFYWLNFGPSNLLFLEKRWPELLGSL